jgi:hypothetical protein
VQLGQRLVEGANVLEFVVTQDADSCYWAAAWGGGGRPRVPGGAGR